MKKITSQEMFIFISIIFLVSNFAMSGYIISRSLKAQVQRQTAQEYIKCIALLRYDATPEQLTTRDGAERALNTCAEK